MSNPNDCSTCGWKAHDGKGHCYMMFDEPDEICMQHSNRKNEAPSLSLFMVALDNLESPTKKDKS